MCATKYDRTRMASQLAVLKGKYAEAMRGRMVPSAKAARLMREIDSLKAEIEAADRDAAEMLALEKAPVDEVLEVIAIPLLDVDDTLVDAVKKKLMSFIKQRLHIKK